MNRRSVDNAPMAGNLEDTVASSQNGAHTTSSAWPYETVRALNGNYVTRPRSSLFYWGALVALIAGIVLLSNGSFVGGFLILTVAPCLLLYPLVRFLFGGKDSAVAVVTTVVVEEVLKNEFFKAVDRSSRKRE